MRSSPGQPVRGFPEGWSRHLPALSGRVTLDAAGYSTTVDILKTELERVYVPLLAMLNEYRKDGGGRFVAGLAGIPGSGKSTFAAVLGHVADRVWSPGRLIVVGMDGWHWPNTELDERTTRDADGKTVPLRQRKGGPASFDVASMAAALRSLRRDDRTVLLPAYDRQRHDPVPERITVPPEAPVVLIEGNYLLSRTPPWDTVSDLLHPKLYLECDPALARERILARHVRGGATPEQATGKFDGNDRLNIDTVLATASHADVRFQLTPEPRLLYTRGQ